MEASVLKCFVTGQGQNGFATPGEDYSVDFLQSACLA